MLSRTPKKDDIYISSMSTICLKLNGVISLVVLK
jgi:hypothetical protein